MARFFKREEKRPFNYPAIEEYKGGSKYTAWHIFIGVLLILLVIYFLIK